MTLSRIISAASGVLGGMGKTPPLNGDGGAVAGSASPADEVDRLFHSYMGGGHQHQFVHHYPQNPYTSADYYGGGGGGDGSGLYYPSQYGLYNPQGFGLKYGLADSTGYGEQTPHQGGGGHGGHGGVAGDPYGGYGGGGGGGGQQYGPPEGASGVYHAGGGGGGGHQAVYHHQAASGGGGHYPSGAGGGAHHSYAAPVAHSSHPRSHKSSKHSSSAMSALTLLAFLFFLNILQSCLKEHMLSMNPTVMVMTAGTSNRRVTLKTTEENYVGVQPAVDQVDYNVYTPDVQVDDKLGMQYGHDHDGRSLNRTIMAKLVNYEEDAKRRQYSRITANSEE